MKPRWILFAAWCLFIALVGVAAYVNKCTHEISTRPDVCWQHWQTKHTPIEPIRLEPPERIHPPVRPEPEPSTPPRQPERQPAPPFAVPT